MPFEDDVFWDEAQPCIDSRQLEAPRRTVFFALPGALRHGSEFIEELYGRGVRRFVVERLPEQAALRYPQARFYLCSNPLLKLQVWAAWHRRQCTAPLVALTGSNGKTIVKEWLSQLLEAFYPGAVAKSPKSYNSQIGVPLSVLSIRPQDRIAVMEAGISKPGEMEILQEILRPDIGIFTNIGTAHDEGFGSRAHKIAEKWKLFAHCPVVIAPGGQTELCKQLSVLAADSHTRLLLWGEQADLPIRLQFLGDHQLELHYQDRHWRLHLPFARSQTAALENLLNALSVLLYMGLDDMALLDQHLHQLRDVPMRLERKEGLRGCLLLDDTYNNDLPGLRHALDFWRRDCRNHPHKGRTVILSDMPGASQEHYRRIADLLADYETERLIGIGEQLSAQAAYFEGIARHEFYPNTEVCLQALDEEKLDFDSEVVLLKGARRFRLERLSRRLQKRLHATVLEIHLNALSHNLRCYRQRLHPRTRLMAMVKAFAYGSGGYEVARLLQSQGIDYLGVAYTDEGAALRRQGIQTPIMVMNAMEGGFDALVRYRLEPVVYSVGMLKRLADYCKANQCNLPIHVEWDTGMHRLGFEAEELPELLELLRQSANCLRPVSTFSHLAASDEAEHNAFTLNQIQTFERLSAALANGLSPEGSGLLRHILNSAGIAHYPEAQFDMVRLGIGLYGIDPSGQLPLLPVATLKTVISQVRQLPAGATVGYSRKGVLSKPTRIGTLAIGYADGLGRTFGNGRGCFYAQGQRLPTVGNICMDMCFADLSGTDLQEGDSVEVFGKNHPIEQVAAALDTIPYEVLSRISPRIPRIFYED